MDDEIKLAKIKIDYKRRLNWKIILVEKGFLVILIILIGWAADRYLENYKSDLARKQAEAEALYNEKLHKLSAVGNIYWDILDDISGGITSQEIHPEDSAKYSRAKLMDDIGSLQKAVYSSSHLFSKNFARINRNLILLYTSLYTNKPIVWNKYIEFVKYLRSYEDNLLRSELAIASIDSNVLSYELEIGDYFREDTLCRIIENKYLEWDAKRRRD